MRVPAVPRSAIEEMVAAAVAAPSLHNSQPWRFRFHDGVFQVRGDPGRRLPASDPAARAVHLACGAATANLRIAVAAHGREPLVRLLPDPAVPTLIATVRLGGPRRLLPSDKALYAAISWRHTNRGPFQDRRLPESLREELHETARLEGANLLFPEGAERERVLDLAAEAEEAQRASPEHMTELAAWTTEQPGRRDGVPSTAFGPPSQGGTVPLRDFAAGGTRRKAERFEAPTQIAVLETRTDTPLDQVRAGQALQYVLLVATLHDLAASFLTQPLEDGELRRQVHDLHETMGYPQMVLRLGYPKRPASAVPRRDLSEVLEVVS